MAVRQIAWCRRVAAALALSLLSVGPSAVDAVDVGDVLVRSQQASAPGKNMRANFEFVITNAKGENVHWAGQYYRRSGSNSSSRLVFEAPLDLRGTEVVVSGTSDGVSHTRVYLPAIRRVRDLTADMRGESFLGTDFNYEDLGFMQLDFQQHGLKADGPMKEAGDCYTLESIPDRGWWYGRIVRCIDKKTYLPRRTEYYDRSGVLWKVRTLDRIEKIGAFPTATKIMMETVPAGTSTQILLSDIAYNTPMMDSVFEGP